MTLTHEFSFRNQTRK